MRKIACLAIVAVLLATMAVAGHKKGDKLDGTTWKVDVEPDQMAKEKGEREFKETLTFVDGMVSMAEVKKMGFESVGYNASMAGENDWTFTAEQSSPGKGKMVWTGTVHGNDMKGKLIWTKDNATVVTYTFHGNLNT
jgi:hypothetical protein